MTANPSTDIEGTGPSATVTRDARVRAFLPTLDFARSKEFYLALGFTLVLDDEVAIFEAAERVNDAETAVG